MSLWRDGKPADIIVDPDGSVWVSTHPTEPLTWASYVELEEIQSEGFDCTRAAGSGRPSYRHSAGGSQYYPRNPFGKYPRKPESKYGVRDHRPMSDREREQARLYMKSMGYHVDPEFLKKWL